MELPTPISFNQYIQPISLTTVCDVPHLGGKSVIATGTGRTEMDKPPSDFLIRQAHLTTIPSKKCADQKLYEDNPKRVICVYETSDGSQAAYKGDSGEIDKTIFFGISIFYCRLIENLISVFKGGPLVWENDGKLIGVMSSYIKYDRNKQSILQIFMNIPYYFEWIERITGMEISTYMGPRAE